MVKIPSKERLTHIVFEHDDKASKRFDLVVLLLILGSLIVVILDSEPSIHEQYHEILFVLEWVFTGLFTLEYLVRVWLSNKKAEYMLSFYGLVDLLAIIPTFLSLVIVNTQFLVVIRGLRLLRITRILKLGRYLEEAETLKKALSNSRTKIQLFIGTVLTIILITATLMYIVEGPENGFTSISVAMYWSIVTLTTVGYGDITPITPLGKFISAIIMLLGYAIIAVPTGIVSSELTAVKKTNKSSQQRKFKGCTSCKKTYTDLDANFCQYCGEALEEKS
jgi:voltage-gated potassium channel